MKKLIVSLIILAVAVWAAAKIMPGISSEDPQIINFKKIETEQNRGISTHYGQRYFRCNSSHRLSLKSGSQIALKNLDADVKLISWNKDYAEIDILKISTNSSHDLKCKEVMFENCDVFTISTCCNNPQSSTMIQLVIKLPQGIQLDNNPQVIGNIDLRKFNGASAMCR